MIMLHVCHIIGKVAHSQEVVNSSRPESTRKSPNPPTAPAPVAPPTAGGEESAEDNTPLPEVIVPVPTQTIFMQVVEFLLEVKAMPVSVC